MRVVGRISPAKAAQMLGVHVRTIRSWCQKAIAGEPSHLKDVKQHITGYYWVSLAEVKRLMRHNPAMKNYRDK